MHSLTDDLSKKSAVLAEDYLSVTGRLMRHFYCPILYRDESVPLSRGHIVNQAFPNASRRWTVQRTDVESFFGTLFESEFTVMKERGKHRPDDVLADRVLSRRLQPQLLVDDAPVEHYLPVGDVPATHSELELRRDGLPPVRLALKIAPSELLDSLDKEWTIAIQRDVRLQALVSILKAAHLTLFELAGYKYALSAGGHFLGHTILGTFVDTHLGAPRATALENARAHFPEFVNLVRPLIEAPEELKGTISDGYVYLCTGTPVAWGVMVFVRVGTQMHAVITPILEDDESAARFVRFLKLRLARFEVRLARFAGDRWEVAKDSRFIDWPEARFL